MPRKRPAAPAAAHFLRCNNGPKRLQHLLKASYSASSSSEISGSLSAMSASRACEQPRAAFKRLTYSAPSTRLVLQQAGQQQTVQVKHGLQHAIPSVGRSFAGLTESCPNGIVCMAAQLQQPDNAWRKAALVAGQGLHPAARQPRREHGGWYRWRTKQPRDEGQASSRRPPLPVPSRTTAQAPFLPAMSLNLTWCASNSAEVLDNQL